MSENLPATLPKPVSAAQQQHILNIVRRAARTEILPRFRKLAASDVAVKTTADDLVTAADTAAEAMITRALKIAFPTALIVGEEAVAETPGLLDQIGDARSPLSLIQLMAPGTLHMALGFSGVILAVTQFGRPAFGLIYDPLADDWVIADDEMAPRFENAAGQTKPLRTSMGKPLEQLSGFIPLDMFPANKQARLAATLPGFARTHPLRCSAQEYRLIALGHADFVLTPLLHPWDHAAGALICERAGGHVEMLDGGPYTASRKTGHLLVAPDRITWNRLEKVLNFLLD